MDLDIKNKYALVTGGASGIGRSIALGLASEGCNVAICDINKEKVEETAAELKEKGNEAIGIAADVTIAEDIEKVMKTLLNVWGTLYILVNNVGGGGGRAEIAVEETPEKTWLDVYALNALTAIRFTLKAIPLMKKQRWGRVITIASLQGKEGGGSPWYNMAKSAEISLMKTLAMDKELAKCGLTFNSIAPGAVIFEGNEWDIFRRENPEKFQKVVEEKRPLGRLGTPEEIASMVVFLCSEKARLVNGACIAVDGGESKSF